MDTVLPIFSQSSFFHGKQDIAFHSHPGVELILVQKGRCDVTVENSTFNLTPGKLLVIAPECEHNQICHGVVENLFVVFMVEPVFFEFRSRIIDIGGELWCNRLMQNIVDLSLERRYDLCDGLIYSLLKYLIKREEELEYYKCTHPLIVRMVEVMRAHFSEQVTIQELARDIGLSPSYLRSLFKSHIKQSPMTYLQSLRMAHAREYLLNPYWSIAEVADNCGFQDVNYFCRLFRKIHNCTPKEYREVVKSRNEKCKIRL